jgi:hypothetical protein
LVEKAVLLLLYKRRENIGSNLVVSWLVKILVYLLTGFIAKAFREIKKYQRTTELLIPKVPFYRLVKEIIVQEGR